MLSWGQHHINFGGPSGVTVTSLGPPLKRLADPEPTLATSNHQVTEISPEMPAVVAHKAMISRSQASIVKQYANDLAVAAGKLEVIGAPAIIRAQGDDDAVLGCALAAGQCVVSGSVGWHAGSAAPFGVDSLATTAGLGTVQAEEPCS
jgi:hypothetical protein